MSMKDPVEVYQASDSIRAELIRQLLSDAGIEARVASTGLEAGYANIPYGTCPLWVKRGEAKAARAVIEKHEQLRKASAAILDKPYCYHCGEAVQPRQSNCRHCHQTLDWNTNEQA